MAVTQLRESRSVRGLKLAEISASCHAAIVAGVDVGGAHYSLDESDQINIGNLAIAAAQGQSVLYHADGELCRTYSPEEFAEVATAATLHKVKHTTYHNYLKAWVLRTDDPDEVSAIRYGADLPPDLAATLAALLGGDAA